VLDMRGVDVGGNPPVYQRDREKDKTPINQLLLSKP